MRRGDYYGSPLSFSPALCNGLCGFLAWWVGIGSDRQCLDPAQHWKAGEVTGAPERPHRSEIGSQ